MAEDNPINQKVLWRLFERLGYAIEMADDGDQALAMMERRRYGLLITDYHMPGMTGAHLFESLRRNQATSRTPILFMSGEASGEDILKEIASPDGASFLAKPVRLEDFRRCVRELLASSSPPQPSKS